MEKHDGSISKSSYVSLDKPKSSKRQVSFVLKPNSHFHGPTIQLPTTEGDDTIALCEKPRIHYRFFLICFFFLSVSVVLGPLSIHVYRFFKNGRIIAQNIEILDKDGSYTQKLTYLIRVFAVVVSFVYTFNKVQLYVLIFTEFSLIVVYSSFFSVRKPSEVSDMKTKWLPKKLDQDALNISKRYFSDAQKFKMKFFDFEVLQREFKDIDFSVFYFYSLETPAGFSGWRFSIYPTPKHANSPGKASFFSHGPARNVYKLDGIGYTENVLRMCEFNERRFAINTKIARILSRFIVLVRFLGPFAMDLLMSKALSYLTHIEEFVYLFQSIFYLYLIYRCSIVYDVLFYGVVIYIQKWRVLNLLQSFLYHDHEKLKNRYPNPHFVIPENIMSWYFMRKLCNSIFREFYIIVNIVLSYMLIYLALAFIQFAWEFVKTTKVQVFEDIASQKAFDAISGTFTFVLIIILTVSIILIVEINRFDETQAFLLEKNLHTFKVLRNKEQEYVKFISSKESSDVLAFESGAYDQYRRKIQIFKEVYGETYCRENYAKHMKKVIRTLKTVTRDLKEEFRMYPHTLLGLRVDYFYLIRMFAAFSLVGVGKVRQLFQI